MPVNYSIAMRPNPQDPEQPKKAYAQAQMRDELTLKGLSKRISSQTTVSRADVSAVLISAVENMVEALKAGDQVDFGELGKFRLQLTSEGAATAEEFTANNITGVNIQFVPGEELKDLFAGITFNLVPTRAAAKAVLKAEKAGETLVDLEAAKNKGNADGGSEDDSTEEEDDSTGSGTPVTPGTGGTGGAGASGEE